MSSRPSRPDRPLRVLLVEDGPAHAGLLRHAVEGGAPQRPPPEVTHVSTLAQALAALRGDAFDVVLLGLALADSRGLETLDAVRGHEGGAAIVVLAPAGDEEWAAAALERGAEDSLSMGEPEPGRLARALRHAVARRRARAGGGAPQRLQATLDALGTHVAVLDHAGTIVLVNRAWRAFAAANGYRHPAAGVGASYVAECERAEAAGDETAGRVARAIRAVLAGRVEAWEGEYPCHSPAEERYFTVRVTRCHDPALAVVVAHENVTAGRRAEQQRLMVERELRESLERFDLVQRATNDTLWDWDLARGTLAWNHEITRTFGYPPESLEPTLAWWSSRIHPDDARWVTESFEAAAAGDESWAAEYRFRRADGSYAVVLDRCFIQRDPSGAAVRILGSMQDVTEHRRLMAAVEQSEAHYRRLVTSSPQTIYALTAQGVFTEINPAGTELLGRPAGDVVGRHYHDVVAPADQAATDAAFMRLITGEADSVQVELHIVRPSGERRLVCIDAAAIRERGVMVGAHGIARDLTDERAREGHMRMLTAALENLAESVSVLDGAGTIVYANPAHARMLGYPPGSPPPGGVAAFAVDPAPHDEMAALLEHLGEHGTWSGRMARRRLDGRVIPVEMRITRIEQDGRPLVFVMSHDVSQEVEREQRLRRAERLASLGTLVSGVAHELNNPLASIMGFTQLLLMDDRPAGEREDLETVRREAERMAKVVADLRLLGRGTHDDARTREPVDLNDVVRHVVRSRAYALRTRNVAVADQLAAGGACVLADRGQMEQVVLNLLVNAEQAFAPGDGERRVALGTAAAAGGVSLWIADTGPGMEPAVVERIFDPFFTTKPPGEGTGLGLSVVARIVAEHGGEIHVESAPGQGTTFRVELPPAPAEPPDLAPPPAAAPASVTPLRVLVVDDEAPVRRVVARYLGGRGHRVDEAADGAQALAMIDAAGGDGYAVILSDLRMPGLGGDQLLERLRLRGDGTDRRLVFLTGDTASADAERILRHSSVPVLEKPVDMAELARVLEHVTRQPFSSAG